MQSQSKLQQKFFMKIDKLILKYVWKCQEKKIIAKTNLKRENKFGEITLSHIKIYYKATIIKKLVFGTKTKRHNGTEQRIQKQTHTHMVTWFMIRVTKRVIK